MALSLSHNPPTQIWMYKTILFFPVWFLFPNFFSCCFGRGEKFFFFFLVWLIGWILSCLHHQQSRYFVQVLHLLRHSKISHRCCDTNIFLCSHCLYHFEDSIFCVKSPSLLPAPWWPFLSTQAAVQMYALQVAITNLSSLSYITKYASSFLIFVTRTVWNWQLSHPEVLILKLYKAFKGD